MLGLEQRAGNNMPLTVALVNIMPDGAFVDTEGQFRELVSAGVGGDGFEFKLYTLPGIPRSAGVAAVIEGRYGDMDELLANPPDALIVTGTEPVQVHLMHEPYWRPLARLLTWAGDAVPATLLSCLAAHASVLLFDGIERVPRATKASGVYAGVAADLDDPLAGGLPQLVPVPHSRVNGIPEDAMRAMGYRVTVSSHDKRIGWSVATRVRGESLFVLCQGHPEYGTLSLIREYRRDVRRYLLGGGARPYPRLPEGYLSPDGERQLHAFAEAALNSRADAEALLTAFPFESVAAGVKNTWGAASATLYANWLQEARRASRARASSRV